MERYVERQDEKDRFYGGSLKVSLPFSPLFTRLKCFSFWAGRDRGKKCFCFLVPKNSWEVFRPPNRFWAEKQSSLLLKKERYLERYIWRYIRRETWRDTRRICFRFWAKGNSEIFCFFVFPAKLRFFFWFQNETRTIKPIKNR